MGKDRTSKSATNPDQPRQADNVAINDRIAARGADYAYDDNASAEGNDAALIAGTSFTRKVHADGTVEDVPPPVDRGDEDGDDTDRTPRAQESAGSDDGKDDDTAGT